MKAKRVRPWKDEHYDTVVNSIFDEKYLRRKEKTAVPKLVFPAGYDYDSNSNGNNDNSESVLANGSSGILKYLSVNYPESMGHLYPPGELGEEVLEFEYYLEKELGNAATYWVFGNILLSGTNYYFDPSNSSDTTASRSSTDVNQNANKDSIDFFINQIVHNDGPFIEKMIIKLFAKRFLLDIMIKYNNVRVIERENAIVSINKVFQTVDKLLQKNNNAIQDTNSTNSNRNYQKFLFGTDLPTAADITFAALSMPLLFPTQTKRLFADLNDVRQFVARKSRNSNDDINSNGDRLIGMKRILETADYFIENSNAAKYAQFMYDNYRFRK